MKKSSNDGFALIATLSVLILLALLAVGMLTLSTTSLRTASQSSATATAQANARMALVLAIAELQKTVGPDRRITAAADVLENSAPAAEGHAHWVGVWNTENYSADAPNTREFLSWLVSKDPSNPSSPEDPASTDDLLIFEGDTAETSVKVSKVQVTTNLGVTGAYAYWVEDESVKADLGWHEGTFADAGQEQAARLTVGSGPDYGVFEGPFTGNVTYPLEEDSSWVADIGKAISPAEMPLVVSDTSDQSGWIKERRHDFTLGSRGVMADVKLGGLRRDLSLAFEMDGEADLDFVGGAYTNPPALFNQQYGEFVGETEGSDAQTGAYTVAGLVSKYLYGDDLSSGFTFSGDITDSSAVVRGPTWWSLRDYSMAYKRLTGSAGNYIIPSRGNFPNNTEAGSSLAVQQVYGGVGTKNLWDQATFTGGAGNSFHLEKPYQVKYAPVMLGYTALLSVMADPDTSGAEEALALGIDPIFYLWNPYNHRLTADRYVISFRSGLPGRIAIWLEREDEDGKLTEEKISVEDVQDYVSQSAINQKKNTGFWGSYSITNVDLAPGEVKIFTPPVDESRVSANSRHPYNTDAFAGAELDTGSGTLLKRFPIGSNNWQKVLLSEFRSVKISFGFSNSAAENFVTNSLVDAGTTNSSLSSRGKLGTLLQTQFPEYAFSANAAVIDYFEPSQTIGSVDSGDAPGPFASSSISGSKQFCGVFSHLNSPVNFSGGNATPVDIFGQFNPLGHAYTGNTGVRMTSWNQEAVAISRDFGNDFSGALEAAGVVLPAMNPENAFWGRNYGDPNGITGSRAIPVLDVPTAPLLSLAQFAHANLGVRADQPMYMVGNSLATPFISPVSPYGALAESVSTSARSITTSDTSWLANDALFDRYYLSGLAPEFTLNGSYSATGTLRESLEKFYGVSGSDYREALANPVLEPYLPESVNNTEAVTALTSTDGKGYLKMGAYSLIKGPFNVNSTSVSAWTALLRGNRGLTVTSSEGTADSSATDTPFPRGTSPSKSPLAESLWSGFSRLTDAQIDTLATEIVAQVKLRGPFMSLADFVNHRVGSPIVNETHYKGALQAAIDLAGINASVTAGAGGTTVNYSTSAYKGSFVSPSTESTPTTNGIATSITQADLLLPLAPRLTVRADTFKIRAYGEALAKNGTDVLAHATCEAIIQRLPEYTDPTDDPWAEANYDAFGTTAADRGNPLIKKTTSNLTATNDTYGRRFKVVSFRWLNADEI